MCNILGVEKCKGILSRMSGWRMKVGCYFKVV